MKYEKENSFQIGNRLVVFGVNDDFIDNTLIKDCQINKKASWDSIHILVSDMNALALKALRYDLNDIGCGTKTRMKSIIDQYFNHKHGKKKIILYTSKEDSLAREIVKELCKQYPKQLRHFGSEYGRFEFSHRVSPHFSLCHQFWIDNFKEEDKDKICIKSINARYIEEFPEANKASVVYSYPLLDRESVTAKYKRKEKRIFYEELEEKFKTHDFKEDINFWDALKILGVEIPNYIVDPEMIDRIISSTPYVFKFMHVEKMACKKKSSILSIYPSSIIQNQKVFANDTKRFELDYKWFNSKSFYEAITTLDNMIYEWQKEK